MLSCGRTVTFRCSSMKWASSNVIVTFSPTSKLNFLVGRRLSNIIPIRLLSTKDLFGNMETSVAENLSKIPKLQPPNPRLTVEEMAACGQSILTELDLWTWWKPTSYFRWALESIHNHLDVPWWGTIIVATFALKLALVFVPIMSQKMIARQNLHKKELDEFKERVKDAKAEGNNLLVQQIFLEQRDFMLSKEIRLGRQFMVLLLNMGIFTTQFFAIRKMIVVNYPGLSTGGALWFTDLTVCDPYYILPVSSALTLFIVTKIGIESGTSADQMSPLMRTGMLFGLPAFIFAFSSQFSSALTLYWVTSNSFSVICSCVLQIPAVRKALDIPLLIRHPAKPGKKGGFAQAMADYRASKNIPPKLEEIKKKDAENFKKAGRGNPTIKVNSG